MAIDDNTTYGLTGAQVKELPGKIEAVKGLARELTADDYNYPTSDPTRIVLADLPDGFYTWTSSTDMQVSAFRNTTILYTQGGWALVMNDQAATGSAFKGKAILCNIRGSIIEYWHGTNSSTQNTFYISAPINTLNSTSTTAALSANQGKVLAGRIGDLSTLTTTDKTSAVAAINEIAAGGGGSSYVAGDGISIDEESGAEVISATNTGEAKILTTDDYNWPTTGTKTSVALWLVEPGVYDASTNGATVSVSSGSAYNNGIFLVSGTDNSVRTIVRFEANTTNPTAYVTNANTGASIKTKSLYTEVVNNLTSTNTDKALSAKQGKVLDEKIPTITMTTTDPGEGSALAANNFVAVYGTDGDAGYALAETNTGTTWVDGSTIYKKTINFGALPNASSKTVAHGITNLSRVIRFECVGYRSTDGYNFPIPISFGGSDIIRPVVHPTDIDITTTVDRSSINEVYVTLYYTKSS